MLKRNKAIAIAIAFVFCMSFIAPALIAPSIAQAAAVDYSFSGAGEFKSGDTAQDIGDIVVSIAEARMLPANGAYYDYLTVSLPSGMEFFGDPAANIEAKVAKIDPTGVGGKRTATFQFQQGASSPTGSTKILIPLNVKVKDASGEVNVTLGGTGIFRNGTSLAIGKSVSSGSTTSTINSAKALGDGGGPIDDIIISENIANTFENNKTITLKLPNGFTWRNGGSFGVSGEWGLTVTGTPTGWGSRELDIALSNLASNRTALGRLVIANAEIDVEDDSRTGDISVNISGAGVTETDLVVAKYGTYNVTVTEDTVQELTAGKDDVKVGSFIIEEEIPGSLVGNRTVTLELPSGVKWTTAPTITVKKGDNDLSSPSIVSGSKGKTLKYTISSNPATSPLSKLLLEKGKVYIEPGFEGPIEIKVGGTAGVEGTVKVAEVKPAVTMKAEGVKDVVVGSQNQKVADILIVENDKEAILKSAGNDQIVVALDEGYKFYKKPVVEVTEGDLEIDTTKLNSNNDELTIKIKYDSSKASTIKLSDVYVTGFRSAPEGPVRAVLVEAEDNVGSDKGSTALDEGYSGFSGANSPAEFSETSAGEVVIANCVTPASSGASISFKVGSNIYTVNGVNKVMDASPYIKGDRTYVPMRYMAETLGAEVVWDQTAQTVTLTKGDTVVVFTIGSTTYTVNGESAVADVAPEITSDRTMLPARYAAEALGAVVGWDAGTQTVIINQ
jgi:hypothetical protein